MNYPQTGDYIDIHVHDGTAAGGIFIVESLMAHEQKKPVNNAGIAFTYGIHPWFLAEENWRAQLDLVGEYASDDNVIAIGEAGFDKLRGPDQKLQAKIFEEQVKISESIKKPLIIHAVRSWDEILHEKKNLKPQMPWMIHGFRGKVNLAGQLVSKGFYLSIWFEFAARPESASVIRSIPPGRLFLETDGADIDIKHIYRKVSHDLGITDEELRSVISENYRNFFNTAK